MKTSTTYNTVKETLQAYADKFDAMQATIDAQAATIAECSKNLTALVDENMALKDALRESTTLLSAYRHYVIMVTNGEPYTPPGNDVTLRQIADNYVLLAEAKDKPGFTLQAD